ncbi:MAG: radical SAM protein, partial [Thermoplasmata archaeon]
MDYSKTIDGNKVIFVINGTIEVKIPKKIYDRYSGRYDDEEIISSCTKKELYNAVTGRRLY